MSRDCDIYLDANESLAGVVALLRPLLNPDTEVESQGDDPLDRVYDLFCGFVRVRVQENRYRNYDFRRGHYDWFQWQPTRYRYWIGVISRKASVFEFGDELYAALKEADTLPVLLEHDVITKEFHHPASYVPDHPIITFDAPMEILFDTKLKERELRRELTRLSGLDFSRSTEGVDSPTFNAFGVHLYLQVMEKSAQKPSVWYGGTKAAYSLRIFGIGTGFGDDPPRREHRNAFAAGLYAKLQPSALFKLTILEVKEGQLVPF